MGLYVQTNASALNAQRNISNNTKSFERVYQRLSSGYRINSAKDDAAGLAISTRMTAQVRGINTAIRNTNDGVSLAQTVEGALHESTSILQRMRELSVQGANDVNTASDRRSINDEIQQLIVELNRIGDTTTFNSHKVLNGDFIQRFLHVGADADENVTITVHDARATALGRTVVTESDLTVTTAAFDKAAGSIQINNITMRNTSDADDTVSTSFASGSAIAKAAAINDASKFSGVTAKVLATEVGGNNNITSGTLDEDSYIVINGEIITGFHVEDDDANGELVNQINAFTDKTGVVASLDSNYRLELTAVDGRNIEVVTTDLDAAQFTGLTQGVYTTTQLESDAAFFLQGNDTDAVGFAQDQVVAVNSATSSVSTVNTLTRASSNRGIEIIDRALEQISKDRSELGALQNRLESTMKNLSSISENVSASRSRIMDADFAAESAEMARLNILQQQVPPSWLRRTSLVSRSSRSSANSGDGRGV